MIHNIIVKISETLNTKNLLKTYLQCTYPIDFYTICSHFQYGKMKIFDLKKKDNQKKKKKQNKKKKKNKTKKNNNNKQTKQNKQQQKTNT